MYTGKGRCRKGKIGNSCSQKHTLPCKVGNLTMYIAVDTKATIYVMSENSFRTLRRSFRGGRCTLLPNYLNVVGVSGSSLEILGKILLKVSPGNVTPNFALPVDAILGLNTMKDL